MGDWGQGWGEKVSNQSWGGCAEHLERGEKEELSELQHSEKQIRVSRLCGETQALVTKQDPWSVRPQRCCVPSQQQVTLRCWGCFPPCWCYAESSFHKSLKPRCHLDFSRCSSHPEQLSQGFVSVSILISGTGGLPEQL